MNEREEIVDAIVQLSTVPIDMLKLAKMWHKQLVRKLIKIAYANKYKVWAQEALFTMINI